MRLESFLHSKMASGTVISAVILTFAVIIVVVMLLYHRNRPAPSEAEADRLPVATKDILLWVAVFFGTLLIFRGTSNLIDEYFLPDKPFYSNIVTLLVGLLIVALTIWVTPKAILPTHA